MKAIIYLIVFLTLISCRQNKKQQKEKSKEQATDVLVKSDSLESFNVVDSSELIDSSEFIYYTYEKEYENRKLERMKSIKRDLEIDTIFGKPISYFLEHPKLAENAKQYYNGEIYPSDDEKTFKLLDTLTKTNSEMSPFYKYLFSYLSATSDGALAEMIGSSTLAALDNNTQLYFSTYVPNHSHICFELSFSYDFENELQELEKNWKSKTDSTLHGRIECFVAEIKATVIEIKEEE